MHGGSVTCESEGVGCGSRFTICLPHLEDQSGEVQQEGKGGAEMAMRPLRILVVDDNVDAAAMLTMLLEASGHQVLTEHDSRSALERAQHEKPDICLLDIGLPRIDGNQLAHRLRSQPGTEKSLLIAITGYGQENDRKQGHASGFDHYLTKPVDTKKLLTLLAAASRV